MNKLLPFFLFFSLWMNLYGQDTIVSKLPQLSICPGNVTFPVAVENFNSVASLSLIILYDSTYLKYQSYQNVNSVFGSSFFLVNAIDQQVIISWFSLQPVTIGNGNLLELNFEYLGHKTIQLNWNILTPGTCVYTNYNGEELPAKFIDGKIKNNMMQPGIISPENSAINLPIDLNFTWTGSNCAPHYELQLSQDSTFEQVDITVGSIFGTSYTHHGLAESTKYFCRIRGYNLIDTTTWSDMIGFKTKDPDGITEIENSDQAFIIQSMNNPVKDIIWLSILVKKHLTLLIKITDIRGNESIIFKNFQPEIGRNELSVTTSNYPTGSYFLIIEGIARSERFVQCKKMIKQ